LTAMGIGEALVTVLNEKGIPTPLAHTLLRAPISRMDILSHDEIDQLVSQSSLVKKYNVTMDRKSAFEILDQKITAAEEAAAQVQRQTGSGGNSRTQNRTTKETSIFDDLSKNTMVRQIGRTIFRELTRGIMGSVSGKKRR
jgi:uncharacterized protein